MTVHYRPRRILRRRGSPRRAREVSNIAAKFTTFAITHFFRNNPRDWSTCESGAQMNTPLMWRTSSYSASDQECVEVAPLRGGTAVRDTKAHGVGHLIAAKASWLALIETVGNEQ